MSIANYSVVGRILAEVRSAPASAALGARERRDLPDQLFELRRTAVVYERPFATPFHFWAHALHDLLESRQRLDLFEAVATHALCRVEEAGEARSALGVLAARVGLAVPGVAADLRQSYRMIDQEVMCSWVTEGPSEFVAFFWLRPEWLAEAEPWDPEEEEGAAFPE